MYIDTCTLYCMDIIIILYITAWNIVEWHRETIGSFIVDAQELPGITSVYIFSQTLASHCLS